MIAVETPSLTLQQVGKKFFDEKTEKSYSLYYKSYYNIAYRSAMEVLKDDYYANLVCSELFTSLWVNRDKFMFDNNKSHIGYIKLSAHNKAKIQYRKKLNYRETLESSMSLGDGDDESNVIERTFYNNGNSSNPLKNLKQNNSVFDRISMDTEVFVTNEIPSYTKVCICWYTQIQWSLVGKKYRISSQSESYEVKKVKLVSKSIDRGIVTGEFMNNVIVEYVDHYGELQTEMFSKDSVTIIDKSENNNRTIHLRVTYDNAIDTIQVKKSGFFNIDESVSDKSLFDIVMDDIYGHLSKDAHVRDRIIDRIRCFEDGNLLYDAMVNKENYSELAKKYNLGTSGAVKTRVFRAKTRLNEMVMSEKVISDMRSGKSYTGKLSYYDEKGRLLYKANYLNSRLHGQFCSFHPNQSSTVRIQTNFYKGYLHGNFKEYDQNNYQLIEGTYSFGVEDGVFIYYNDNKISKKVTWDLGEPILMYEYKNGVKVNCRLFGMDENEHPITPTQFDDCLYGIKKTSPELQD